MCFGQELGPEPQPSLREHKIRGLGLNVRYWEIGRAISGSVDAFWVKKPREPANLALFVSLISARFQCLPIFAILFWWFLQHFYRIQFVCWIFASTLPTSRLQGHGRAIPVAVVTWWMFSWATRMRLQSWTLNASLLASGEWPTYDII